MVLAVRPQRRFEHYDERERDTHSSVHLVLLRLALLLDHEKRVIEQKHHQLRALALAATTFLQRALVDELASFVL